MKLLSIVVPSYNSQGYLRTCIDSLLPGGERVEILIVNDGSSDQTGEIAEEYARTYPNIVRVFHQENGGHGEAVNTGMRHATGMYFKVVDSDDWVNLEAYEKVLDTLQRFEETQQQMDMLVCNYVYENESVKKKRVITYEKVLPQHTMFTWDEVGRFKKGQYLLMHSVIYRTSLLRECGLQLPKHTFYVDNLYVYIPMHRVTKMYYLNVDFYRYFIGRVDQSVNERNMMKRIDQQLYVNRCMLDYFVSQNIENHQKRQYMRNYLEIITVVSSIILLRTGTKEALEKKRRLWEDIRRKDFALYYRLRFGVFGLLLHLPGKTGRSIAVKVYKIAQKTIGFNES